STETAPSPSGSPGSHPTTIHSTVPAATTCLEPLDRFRLSVEARRGVPADRLTEVRRAATEARDFYRVQVPVCRLGRVDVRVLDRSKGNVAAQTHVDHVPRFRIDVFASGPAWARTPFALRAV